MAFLDSIVALHSSVPVNGAISRQATTQSRAVVGQAVETVRRRPMVRADELTPTQLRGFYRKSSAVRPPVDGLVRVIAMQDWAITPLDAEAYDETHVTGLAALFQNPNPNDETFEELLSRIVLDLLVLDRFVVELVLNSRGQVLELWARDAGTFHPLVEASGIVQGYEQRIGAGVSGTQKVIRFAPDEVIWRVLYPRTDSAYGTPIIETLVNEISALIFSIQHIALTFTDDEIPPGVLWLGDMGEEVWKRVKESVRQGRNRPHEDLRLRVLGGSTVAPQWIKLKDAPRDVQLAQLRKDIEAIVWRCFGKSPVSMGRTEGVPRASAEVQQSMEDSSLVTPILRLLSKAFTHHIIRGSYGYDDVEFRFLRDVEEDQEEKSRIAERITGGRLPIFTLNEVRQKLYHEPPFDFPAAKRPFMVTGRGDIVFLDELGTTAPAPSAVAESIADGLVERSAPVGTLDLDRVERLVVPYTSALLSSWTTMRGRVLREAVKGLVERTVSVLPNSLAGKVSTARWDEKRVRILDAAFTPEPGVGWHRQVETVKAVEQPQEARVQESLARVLGLMEKEFEDAAGKAFSFGVEIGFAEAHAAIPQARLAGNVKQALLREHIQRNGVYVRENLIGDVLRDLRMALAPVYASVQEFLAALSHAIDRHAFRLPRYGRAVVAVSSDAFAQMGTATGAYQIAWIDTGDERECAACQSAKANSPYRRRADLPFFPGQSPECDGECRCSIRLEKITT